MPDLLTAAALGPRLRGAPVILNVHDTFPELFATKYRSPPGDRLEWLLKREERLSAALASRVVTVTDMARLRLESRGVGVGRTTVVMNSPDQQVFGPPREPVRWPADGRAAGALPRWPRAAVRRREHDPGVGAAARERPASGVARVRLRRGSGSPGGAGRADRSGAHPRHPGAGTLRADSRRVAGGPHRRRPHAARPLHGAAGAP